MFASHKYLIEHYLPNAEDRLAFELVNVLKVRRCKTDVSLTSGGWDDVWGSELQIQKPTGDLAYFDNIPNYIFVHKNGWIECWLERITGARRVLPIIINGYCLHRSKSIGPAFRANNGKAFVESYFEHNRVIKTITETKNAPKGI